MTRPGWPKRAPFAVCPTHDVDRIRKYAYHYLYYGVSMGRRGPSRQWRTFRDRMSGREPYWNFRHIMDLEERLGVRSTFLFLNESARGFGPVYWGRYRIGQPEVRKIIRELAAGGWEIGLHGSLRSYVSAELLVREKRDLEDIAGVKVRSTRQHCLNFLPGKTFEIQQRAGLEVDSTIGFSTRLWDPAEGVLPYYPDGYRILELPISVMDTVELEQAQTRKQIWDLFDAICSAGGLVVLDWHQCKFNPSEHPHHINLYESLLREALSRNAWIATMGDIADHWKGIFAAP